MVDPLTWVLAGIGAYWIGVLWLERTGRLPEFVGTQGPKWRPNSRAPLIPVSRLA